MPSCPSWNRNETEHSPYSACNPARSKLQLKAPQGSPECCSGKTQQELPFASCTGCGRRKRGGILSLFCLGTSLEDLIFHSEKKQPHVPHGPTWTRLHPCGYSYCMWVPLYGYSLRVDIPELCILQVLYLISNSPHCASQIQQGFMRQGELRLGNRTLQTNRGGSISCFIQWLKKAKKKLLRSNKSHSLTEPSGN